MPAGSDGSACQTIAGSLPEIILSARAMSRSRLIPGKTRIAAFMAKVPTVMGIGLAKGPIREET
ncbi:hypothetical protein BwSH20_50450 [Bradyrhizobium ottawaense]|nr:hypothetical protein SG09_67630 [Bradyrhizobium ottawaense]GMO37638.1 hypothetical protein BwSF21_46040 [Bradyrhizobium ottawaense]GMO49629.1 hypothetical protein BwSH14_69900 [Bradyrhizobium ottawaense]GMO66512.1 hypothetical protein BwSF19_00880 [Bradyrhizobium ottawaense]GMO79654.1 hypothetical protein BwSH17_51650 [Bradyrhizobium ottawaense]